MKKLNKDEITADDVKEAENEKQERIKIAEEARLEALKKLEGGEQEQEAQPDDEWLS